MEQPIVNGAFQFLNAVKSTASNHPFRNQAKESFDLVEPRTAGRCEVKVEPATFLGFEPTLDFSTFVGRVVVQHNVDVQIAWYFFFNLVEKLQEFLTSMTGQTTADDLAIQDVKGGK